MRQQIRHYIYAYAAVAPALGKICCLVLPYANTAMINLFLAQVSAELAEYFIIVQVDTAAWHLAKSLRIPEKSRLLRQPPYSAEVMPVEHLWHEIREKHFANHIFKTLDAVEDTLSKALQQLDGEPSAYIQ